MKCLLQLFKAFRIKSNKNTICTLWFHLLAIHLYIVVSPLTSEIPSFFCPICTYIQGGKCLFHETLNINLQGQHMKNMLLKLCSTQPRQPYMCQDVLNYLLFYTFGFACRMCTSLPTIFTLRKQPLIFGKELWK